MKTIVFDSSSLISLSLNDLSWVLHPLREAWGGQFVIPAAVEYEIVRRPLASHKFKWEAIMMQNAIRKGVLVVHEEVRVENVVQLMNTVFSAQGKAITIVQRAEVEAVVVAMKLHADALVIDERTMRLLIENPERLHHILEGKLHTKIAMDKQKLRTLQEFVKGLRIIRSTELMLVALEKGILYEYMETSRRKDVADAILWGLRLRGCAISTEEILELTQIIKN